MGSQTTEFSREFSANSCVVLGLPEFWSGPFSQEVSKGELAREPFFIRLGLCFSKDSKPDVLDDVGAPGEIREILDGQCYLSD